MKSFFIKVISYFVLKYKLLNYNSLRKYVLTYCREGITSIEGTGPEEGNTIAYAWRFYDEDYENRKNSR